MEREMLIIKHRIEDYSRFLITLLILSFYLYLGLLITTFIQPEDHVNILIVLMLICISIAGVFAYMLRGWQQQLNKLEK